MRNEPNGALRRAAGAGGAARLQNEPNGAWRRARRRHSRSVAESDAEAAPDFRVAAELIVQTVGVVEVALEVDLAVTHRHVQQLIHCVAQLEPDLVVLEAGVAPEGAVIETGI